MNYTDLKNGDKKLLLIDLSARFPYNVAIDCRDEDSRFTCYLTSDILREIQNNTCYWDYKPFLFPLSSMSERQCYELSSIRSSFQDCWKYIKTPIPLSICNFEQIEWLHKNHFDYRGLIEKGLAIDATNLNVY